MRSRHLSTAFLLALLVGTIVAAAPATAAPRAGSLLGSFSGDGVVQRGFGSQLSAYGGAYFVVERDRGPLLVGLNYTSFTLMGLRQDGSPDPQFGRGGVAFGSYGLGVGESLVEDLALDRRGRIVVAGGGVEKGYEFLHHDFAFSRFLPDGRPDPGFGRKGNVLLPGRPPVEYGAETMLPLPGGGVFAVGGVETPAHLSWAIEAVRLRPDGSLDRSFGRRGFSYVRTPHRSYRLPLLAGLQAGRPVLMVPEETEKEKGFSLLRFAPDGRLDPSFGRRGRVHHSGPRATGFAVMPDGGFLVLGKREAIRLRPDGSLDQSFDTTALAELPLEALTLTSRPRPLPDGRILLVGETHSHEEPSDLLAVRLDADGSLDRSFGGGRGYVTTAAAGGGDDGAFDAAPLPDGGAIAVGVAGRGRGSRAAAVRYQADGSLLPGFGRDGIAEPLQPLPARAEATSIVVDREGGVTAAAITPERSALVSYAADGRRNRGFGDDGLVRGERLTGPLAQRRVVLARYPDGRLLVSGREDKHEPGKADGGLLRRYLPGGRLDRGFGRDGTLELPLDRVSDLKIDPDGTALVAGRYLGRAAVMQLRPSGRVDRAFGGGDGVATAVLSDRNGRLLLARSPGGKILLAGASSHGFVVEFGPRGGRIEDFGKTGKGTRGYQLPDRTSALAVDRQGRILVGGTLGDDLAVVRLRADGILDRSFGQAGTVHTSFGGKQRPQLGDLALEADGSILLAGTRRVPCGSRCLTGIPVVLRFGADGRPDRTFARRGTWQGRLGPSAGLNDLALTSGAIVAGGWKASEVGGRDLMLIRLAR